ncbi:putative adrenomedullin-5-like protein [Gorilla gorilla gorilla]|uniref:Adrenomedullin 5 (putative) n=1 Tax=Gorilla gorilla gorilla TaxID=9595 RepID=G3S364_GORGO|nr:putative adrenomedullin-5-like protein [Gorilla gorilla gorilla]
MTIHILILLLLLAFSAQRDLDTAARRGQHQVPQHRGHVCYLGVCRTHRLTEIIYWIRCLHEGALGEGQPRAPGPLQLWAPPAARGGSPARFPGFRPAARGLAQCPARWVTSGTARPLLGFSLPICILELLLHISSPLTPAPETVFPSPSPGCDLVGPRSTRDQAGRRTLTPRAE